MKTKLAVLVALAALLSACGDGLKGTWTDEMGMSSYTFHGNGKAIQTVELAGVEVEMEYEVDGDKVRLSNPHTQGVHLALTRIDGDTLSGPMGVKYRRRR